MQGPGKGDADGCEADAQAEPFETNRGRQQVIWT